MWRRGRENTNQDLVMSEGKGGVCAEDVGPKCEILSNSVDPTDTEGWTYHAALEAAAQRPSDWTGGRPRHLDGSGFVRVLPPSVKCF